MDSDRSNKRAMRSGVEGEASSSQPGAAAAGGAGELSALEALPGDVLEAVLQQLGPVKASRVRLVNRKMREAFDRVQWQSLQLEASDRSLRQRSVEQIWLLATRIAKRRPGQLQGAHTAAGLFRARGLKLQLASGCEVRLAIQFWEQTERHRNEAVKLLFSACSASSGGLGGVFLDRAEDCGHRYEAQELERLAAAVLKPLSAPEAGGNSCQTLKSIIIDLECGPALSMQPLTPPLVKLVSSFPHLERLQLPYMLGAAASTIPGALPALRSAGLKLVDGAALAAFAAHPALEELNVQSPSNLGDSRAFETFAMGPAARRLRRLEIRFGSSGFQGVELPSLSRLTSLETLHLAAHVDPEELGPDVYEQVLGGLEKLRELRLELVGVSPAQLRGLARAFAALRKCSLRAVRLTLAALEPEDKAAVAETIPDAGPALVELSVSLTVFCGDVRRALAACPSLRTLRLKEACVYFPYPPLAALVGDLAACPRLQEIDELPIALHRDQEAADVVEPLRRLASACSLGDGSKCRFQLFCRSDRVEIAKAGVKSVFPKATAELRQIL